MVINKSEMDKDHYLTSFEFTLRYASANHHIYLNNIIFMFVSFP